MSTIHFFGRTINIIIITNILIVIIIKTIKMELLIIIILLYNYSDKYRILFSQCTFSHIIS